VSNRRENLPTALDTPSYLHDGEEVIQRTGVTSAVNYLRVPGSGEMLMESSGATNAVPLLDASGSTVAMVDSASGNVTSQYTYDPLGGAAVSGGGYQSAYQYLGMENDGWAYYGGHHYYSPIMGRTLALNGPLSSAGGTENRGYGFKPRRRIRKKFSAIVFGGSPPGRYHTCDQLSAPSRYSLT
jgi:hypothetical protein